MRVYLRQVANIMVSLVHVYSSRQVANIMVSLVHVVRIYVHSLILRSSLSLPIWALIVMNQIKQWLKFLLLIKVAYKHLRIELEVLKS